MTELLIAHSLTFSYRDTSALRGVSLTLSAGGIVAVLGPNGSGKSTLLKVLLGDLLAAGQILWQGTPLSAWRRRDLARLVAYLPQSPAWEPGQTVAGSLGLGRAPYWGPLGLESTDDSRIVIAAAERLGLIDLMDRRMDELSGGQRQRVLLGRCLVQQPKAMLLDEPDTHLDLKHQLELCRSLRELARGQGLAVLIAWHDLNLAAAFADEVIVLKEGAVAARGAPAEALQPAMLEEVYGLPMERIDRPGRSPILLPKN